MSFSGNLALLPVAAWASLILGTVAGIYIVPSGRISGRVVPVRLMRRLSCLN
jgi:hypothetical protein